MAEKDGGFNPAEYVIRIQGGAEYLQVKHRLLWLRSAAPESQVRTELVQLTPEIAVFKASVTRIEDGAITGMGEGHGTEVPRDFKDYIEKAETKAIGRALGALGYGTDAAFEEDPSRPADAPRREEQSDASAVRAMHEQARQGRPNVARPTDAPTEKQTGYMWGLASDLYGDAKDELVHADIVRLFGANHPTWEASGPSTSDLNRLEVSDYINWLKAKTQQPAQQPAPQRDAQQTLAAMPQDDPYPSDLAVIDRYTDVRR